MKPTEQNKQNIGLRIKSIRQNLGMTLEEFGKLLNAGKSNVRKWEIGASLPNPERIKNIAKLGNMTVDELLYGSFKENIVSLLIMFEVMLKNNKSVPTELHDSIIKSVKNRYIDSNGNLIEDWYYYDSLEDLIKSFNDYAFRIIEMAKKGTLKEETNLSSFITNIENAFSDFLDYYILSSINENSETTNTSKDVFNLELKDKVSKITMEYLNKLNDIEYYKIHDEMNNNQ